ncbi:hypothetical protein [Phreatobacter sp.]|uniref:hypothetical protein n=1 Tax=Phreatobacter sp. TaxID=1966341 RepID=UPI003F72A0BD
MPVFDMILDSIFDGLVSAIMPKAITTGLISVTLIGGALIYGQVMPSTGDALPTCLSSKVRVTLTGMAVERGVVQPRVRMRLPVVAPEGERQCKATLTDGTGRSVPMTYRIFRAADGQTRVEAAW